MLFLRTDRVETGRFVRPTDGWSAAGRLQNGGWSNDGSNCSAIRFIMRSFGASHLRSLAIEVSRQLAPFKSSESCRKRLATVSERRSSGTQRLYCSGILDFANNQLADQTEKVAALHRLKASSDREVGGRRSPPPGKARSGSPPISLHFCLDNRIRFRMMF